MDFGFSCAASFGWRYASVELLDNALTVGIDYEGRLHLPLKVSEFKSVLAFLRHLNPCWARSGASAKSAVFFKDFFCCEALQAPYTVMKMVNFGLLLAVEKPA